VTRSVRRDDVGEDTASTDTPGAHVWWLITDATVPHARCVLNVNEMPAGSGHLLHRHPHADQVLYLARGHGWQLTETGNYEAHEGDAVYVARGDWHGFYNPGPDRLTLVSVYPEVPSGAAAGYEQHPDAASLQPTQRITRRNPSPVRPATAEG